MMIFWLTFKELLACVLLKEGFMHNWLMKVVNHQLEDRLNLFLGVTGVVRNGRVLKSSDVINT